MSAMDEIKKTFFQECDEQLQELETGLLRLERGDDDAELINAIFRAVHSIKGGAGAFALDDLVRFAHVFETVLDMMRSGRLAASADVVRVMLRASDTLADIVGAARDEQPLDEDHSADSLAALQALMSKADGAEEEETIDFQPLTLDIFPLDDLPPAGEPRWTITFKPHPGSYERGNEPILLLRALSRLGRLSVTPEIEATPRLEDVTPGESWLWWRVDLTTDADESAIHEIFEFVEDDCDVTITRAPEAPEPTSAPIAEDYGALSPAPEPMQAQPVEDAPADKPRAAKAPAAERAAKEPTAEVSATIRVDLDRIDRLINLVGELVINQAMLSQRVIEAGLTRSSSVGSGLNS
ncbi:MAG TPA: Hpt domain-containing protein, partial [Beijerinckiaceae bacterium]